MSITEGGKGRPLNQFILGTDGQLTRRPSSHTVRMGMLNGSSGADHSISMPAVAPLEVLEMTPKQRARLAGAVKSTKRASRPVSERQKRHPVVKELDHAGDLDGEVVVEVSSLAGQVLEPVTVFEAGKVYDKIGQIFPEEPESLDVLRQRAVTLTDSERDETRQGFYDYGSTARDLRE